ncbi:MAG: hypothetical protein JWP34_749, partial [Massilia sp.]|nr:hypothetical protein [Massilia sp.]
GAPGIIMADSSILSSTGNINMTAYGGGGLKRTNDDGTITRSNGGMGVDLQLSGPAKLSTTSGSLTIYGEDGSEWSIGGGPRSFGTLGVQATIFYGGSIESQSGIVDITGVSYGIGGQGAAFSLSNGHISAAEVLLNGEGHGQAGGGLSVSLADGSIKSSSGDVRLDGSAGSGGGAGVAIFMNAQSAISAFGSMSIGGTGEGSSDGVSVDMFDSSITAGTGMVINGEAGTNGNGISLFMTGSAFTAGSGLVFNGSGGVNGDGISVDMSDSSITAGTGMVFKGDGGTNGKGISLFMTNSAFAAGAGLVFNGSGGVYGDGISVDMSDSRITTGTSMVFNGDAGTNGNGIAVHMTNFGIHAGSSIILNGSAGNGDGISLFADGATISAADITFNGDALENGDGIRGVLIFSAAMASNGQLTMNGTGGGPGAGVKLDMDRSSIGATHGNVEINGTGGDRVGSGVVISSSQAEVGGDGSFGEGGVMSGSSANIYSDHGKIAIAGTNGFATPSADPSMMTQVNGVKLTGIELKAVQGDIRVAGTALPGTNLVPIGVALTNVMASTASGPENLAPGNVEIRAVTNGPTPALELDGVTLGGAAMGGDIIVAARNAGPGQMITYGAASSFHNAVQTSGIINLRPDDLGFGGDAVAGTAIPITIGGPAANFNVAFTSLGIGRSSAANVVVGSKEHTATITFDDPEPFLGKLTLQNDGAGSEGIALASNMNVQGQVTLSTGGTVEGAESAINAASLLLRGTQPESNFQLTNPGNRVAMFAARFDTSKGLTSPAYGDVNYANNGALAIAPMAGTSFSSATNVASTVEAADTVVAGDLLVRTSGDLTLGSNVSTRGSAITLVTGGTFQNISNSALSPGGGDSWRVFADTWVGEVRGGLTPSSPHPNYYNCAYGAPCGDAITGSHFIYRAQPVLTLQANNFARAYGDPNPALTFTQSGLVNGDTLADVASDAYATSAGISSAVGAYPIGGNVTSPVGYAIDARPGTLTVDRAALLISVDDKNKIYGGVDPALSATFSGFKNGENSSVICCLNLTTATGAAATAGIHPIVGANATAANYSISYVPGTLSVAKAPLMIAADNKAKGYGAPDPLLTATMSGFKYADTSAVVSGLTLTAPTGAAAVAGNLSIVAANASASNYAPSYVPGVLAVTPAVLTYVADGSTQFQDTPARPLTGTVTGFVYNDTLASATTGSLAFSAPATPLSPPGAYAVHGSGLAAANYRFIQARFNDTALTLLPSPIIARPTILRNVTFESSNVYEKNFGLPLLCVGTAPLGLAGADRNDALALEWSRLRVSPNLSNCIGLGQRNSCSDF